MASFPDQLSANVVSWLPQRPPQFPSLFHNSTGQTPLWVAGSDLHILNSRILPFPFIHLIVKPICLLGICVLRVLGMHERKSPRPLFLLLRAAVASMSCSSSAEGHFHGDLLAPPVLSSCLLACHRAGRTLFPVFTFLF